MEGRDGFVIHAVCHAVHGALPARLRPFVGEGVGGLTGRELEVAKLVARRFSNKAIGKELGMATRTASTHLSNIFQKLGVSNRGELADLIRDKGVLDD